MAQRTLTEAEALREFWEQLANTGTVMLGVNAVDRHSQPMAAFAERDENAVWFFTRDDTEIAIEAAEGCDGRLTMVSRDRKVYADISGTLATAHDPERVERYWGPTVAAWYPEGKNDPHLVLLRFEPVEGQIWASEEGVMRVAFEIAKANVTKTTPEIGGTRDVNFRA